MTSFAFINPLGDSKKLPISILPSISLFISFVTLKTNFVWKEEDDIK